jgi:tetratricopeptide (TPR) repeat protein
VSHSSPLLSSQIRQQEHRDGAWWSRNTQVLIAAAATGGVRTWHEKMGDFVRWVDVCREQPQLCDPDALARFIEEFARLASSVGEAATVAGQSVELALTQAIAIAEQRQQRTVSLYRAKAIYHRSRSVESEERLRALDEALRRAEVGSAEWVGVLIDLSEYYVEVSRYRDALSVLEPIEQLQARGPLPPRLQLGLDVAKGVALFTSFQNLRRASLHLRRACEVPVDPARDPEAGAWLARALHYQGRIEEANRNFATALRRYLTGLQTQTKLAEDANAIGFVHLRIAELFASCGLKNSAQRHLDRAKQLFSYGSNTSSGRLQSDLGQAALYAASDRADDARRVALDTWRESVRVGYWRGEFLSLCYLLLLDLRRLRLSSAATDVVSLVKTARRGELRRNSLPLLVRNLPVMLSMAFHRLSLLTAKPRPNERLTPCSCPLHPPADAG